MNIAVTQGAIQESAADTVIVNLFEGVTHPGGATGAVDRALNGAISEVIESGDLKGKAKEVTVIYPRGVMAATRVLIVGLGKAEDFDLEGVRQAAASATKRARQLGARQVATIVHGAGLAGLDPTAAAQAVTEASILALYRYRAEGQGASKEESGEIESLTIVEHSESKLADLKAGVKIGRAIADGVSLARDLVNMPPNVATPSKMAETAAEIASAHNLELTVGDRAWAAARNMGAFLAVAQGAAEEPKFIVLAHNFQRENLPTIVLVGKGITFDTGGISLKPSDRMGRMKSDMAGAAAVLGTMKIVGALELPLRLIGITPCTENMPDASAYHPSDVIKASNGKTIEIISTDAEGRMVLADALVFAQHYQADAVVDLATLTGASVVALGQGVSAGLFANDGDLRDRLLAASEYTHERLWPMPLWDDYLEAIKSDVADMKNSGGRFGGVGTSAVFLREFTDYPWAHLDIAGMALADKESGYQPSGATGFGVRLLAHFLRGW
jgi:leucyl aminopeptidase